MSETESATDQADKEEKLDQVSGLSKGANMQMVQNVLLIWLDTNINQDNSNNNRDTVNQLRRVANNINTFTDADECVDFLTRTDDEKVVMIISDALCRYTVPLIHDIVQLDAIFILCKYKTSHEEWAKVWPKIKGFFTEITPVCEVLKQFISQCEQNAISMSFITINDICKKNVDQLDYSFMYTQVLKEILLTITFEQKHIKEFINYCRTVLDNNYHQLNSIENFERKYRDKTPIWWYTYESFLYSMLNRALRKMEINTIMKMGFFINDLHRHIEQLYVGESNGQSSGVTFTVYRGQGMSKADFDQMTKTKGGLMSFNSFLSTSKNYNVSFAFAESNQDNPDLIGILFVMTIDPSKSTTPFSSITEVGFYGDGEDEVLFSMHTVFRICDIRPIGQNHRLFQADLILTSDDDKDLRALIDCIREEIPSHVDGWQRLGALLLRIGELDKAQQVYQTLLEQTTNESEASHIYNQLGNVKSQLGDYKGAIKMYEKSLKIDQETLPTNHPNLATTYNNIGSVYFNMNEYSQALSSQEKALAIQQQILSPNHLDLTITYNNIGNVYQQMGDCSKALSSYEKSLAIQQQSLPSNHPDLAASYNNIGEVYEKMGEYSKALSSEEKALAIQQRSLPPNHPDLTASYNNIGAVYEKMGDYSKALLFHEKSFAIRQQTLPPNHPDLASSYNNIGIVYYNMNDYSQALSSYEKALAIQQQTLPLNHSDLASSYNNIGIVYHNMNNYWQALSSYEKALAIRQQTLPPNHPKLATSYNNIGAVYEYVGDYSKALSFYERAMDIGRCSLPSNHPHLRIYGENVDKVKKKL
jgi:tetratricopeptide (TPR) repeat protein